MIRGAKHDVARSSGQGSRVQAIHAQDDGDVRKMISEPKVAVERCAKTIFEAATGVSSKLRYFVGDDYRGFLEA